MAKKESEQTTLIWWDGKQKKLSDFELGIEQPKMANKPNKKTGQNNSILLLFDKKERYSIIVSQYILFDKK